MTEFKEVKHSGKEHLFKTGAGRDNRDGKGRYDLLPTRAIKRIAVHYENGGKVHGNRNWEKGIPVSRCFDAALRHLFQALEGKDDEDHLAACAWNVLAIIETRERIEKGMLPKELDDLK